MGCATWHYRLEISFCHLESLKICSNFQTPFSFHKQFLFPKQNLSAKIIVDNYLENKLLGKEKIAQIIQGEMPRRTCCN